MLVRLVWPDCPFLNGTWGDRKLDSFWVQCSESEAQQYLCSRVTAFREPDGASEPAPGFRSSVCFLVSRDLTSIVQMPWFYPFSGMWNAYCPFRELPSPVKLKSLEEISRIDVPEELRGMPPGSGRQ